MASAFNSLLTERILKGDKAEKGRVKGGKARGKGCFKRETCGISRLLEAVFFTGGNRC